ncbi:uncharacterized protein [Halyomorpha halys]|uniref:uncharacterized protein isoform X3 n=1 Tax=Halyomorpha halys TaxID=286706 RepID=UPI0034D242EC
MSDIPHIFIHELHSAGNPITENPFGFLTNVGPPPFFSTQRFNDEMFRAQASTSSLINEGLKLPPRKLPRFSSCSMGQEIRGYHPSNICQGNLCQDRSSSYPIANRNVEEQVVTPDKAFESFLEVHEYKKGELKAKLVDGFIIIEGEHGERMDDISLVSQKFTRRYKVPEDIDKGKISCFLSSDGVLCIFGQKILKKKSKEIPIIRVNKPAKNTTKSMSIKVIEKRLLEKVKDRVTKKQTSEVSTNTQTVHESVSPLFGAGFESEAEQVSE